MTSAQQTKTEQIPTEELEGYQDAAWAMNDSNIQKTYDGQFVIAYQRKIIAHGSDPKLVCEEANRLAKGQVHFLVYCAKQDSVEWLKHSSDADMDFSDA
jgi:hypothetical protein